MLFRIHLPKWEEFLLPPEAVMLLRIHSPMYEEFSLCISCAGVPMFVRGIVIAGTAASG